MPIVRGFVTSLVFAIAWMAMVFHSRPEMTLDTRDGTQASIVALKTWSFTPAVLSAKDRASYENATTVPDARAALTAADSKIVTGAVVAAIFTLLGMVDFWGAIFLAQKRKTPALGAAGVIGPALPCLVTMSAAGFLLSGPPLAAGVVIAAITLVSKRSTSPAS